MNQKHNHGFRLVLIGLVFAALLGLTQSPVHTTQAQTGGTLGYGSKVYGSISASTPLVTYSFSGSSGDFVTITADSWTGTLDVQLELVAPNGVVLDSSTQNTLGSDGMGAYLAAFLPEDGVYVLRLDGDNGTTGDYLLALLGRSAATATPLVYGQPVDVTIPQSAPPQFFSFETENCPTTLIVSHLVQGFPFVVKVRDQRGQTVALLQAPGRGGEQTEDWVTVQPHSGRYEVEVLTADPALAESLRLLVTCSGDNPGCPAGAGIAGIPGLEGCTTCPGPDQLVPGGGCPDLNLAAQQDPRDPHTVTVTWDALPGADGYAVYVTGIMTGGGEVYLTHADWTPGNPTEFTWILPAEGYIGFRFTLEVLAGGSVLCTQQVEIDIQRTSPNCPDLGLTGVVTDAAVNAVALSWGAGLGADQFALDMYALTGDGEEYGGRLILPADATGRAFDHFPPEFNGVRFVLWMTRGGMLCSDEVIVMFGGQQQLPCAIRTDRRDVPVRVGPGLDRSILTYLPPDQDISVIGQVVDGDGIAWWQIDKSQIPGGDAAASLWVAQSDVATVGLCTQVPEVEIPPVIPGDEPGDQPGDGWGPCGSCDACGHPANECVTSPEGQCLWDPATCANQPPDDGGEPGACYTVQAAIDMGQCFGPGSAMLDTAPNCGNGQYTPGTTLQAHAVAAVDAKCRVLSWSGCSASGSGSSVTFIPGHSCTVTAHMGY